MLLNCEYVSKKGRKSDDISYAGGTKLEGRERLLCERGRLSCAFSFS